MAVISNLINGIFVRYQYLFDNLAEEQKLAFSRLMRELVLADDIVLKKEFDDAPEVKISYLANSASLSYEEAIATMKTAGRDKCEKIAQELEQMGKADGQYTKEERDLYCQIQRDLL